MTERLPSRLMTPFNYPAGGVPAKLVQYTVYDRASVASYIIPMFQVITTVLPARDHYFTTADIASLWGRIVFVTGETPMIEFAHRLISQDTSKDLPVCLRVSKPEDDVVSIVNSRHTPRSTPPPQRATWILCAVSSHLFNGALGEWNMEHTVSATPRNQVALRMHVFFARPVGRGSFSAPCSFVCFILIYGS